MPYSGEIFADAVTGTIWRMTEDVLSSPPGCYTRCIYSIADYDEVAIGNQRYVVEVTLTVTMNTPNGWRRVVFASSNFRKFEADSSITYKR